MLDFNSTKVQLERVFVEDGQRTEEYFNSTKVQLEPYFGRYCRYPYSISIPLRYN